MPALKGALAKPELAQALSSLASGAGLDSPRDEGSKGKGKGKGRGKDVDKGPREVEIQVDQQWVGWLLGGRGKTMRDIENDSGAQVKIDQSTKDHGYSIVRITGHPTAVSHAEKRIQASLATVSGGIAGAEDTSDPSDIQVEQRLVGWILGKSGVVLKEIQNQTGARISIDQSSKDLGYSTVKISGAPQASAFARRLVEEKIAQAQAAG